MRVLLSAIVVILLFTLAPIDTLRRVSNDKGKDRDCWPIPPSQSTGTIRCWSGGQLVYQNSIYHNGGVLCAASGKEIRITGGKSLCVIESNQSNVWSPPTATEGAPK